MSAFPDDWHPNSVFKVAENHLKRWSYERRVDLVFVADRAPPTIVHASLSTLVPSERDGAPCSLNNLELLGLLWRWGYETDPDTNIRQLPRVLNSNSPLQIDDHGNALLRLLTQQYWQR